MYTHVYTYIYIYIYDTHMQENTYAPFSGEEQKWTPEQLAGMDSRHMSGWDTSTLWELKVAMENPL